LPIGATTLPALPVVGNPACVIVSWTPTIGQLGTNDFTFTATDTHLHTASCSFHQLVPAACYQFIGRGGGGSSLIVGGTLFPTFLDTVRLVYPVTMVNRPSLRVPNLPT